MRILFRLFILVLLFTGQSEAQSSAEQNLYSILRTIGSFQATFYQQVLDASGEVLQEATGTFELKKPGRFRWHYGVPYSQHIVADGKNLWMLDLELAQATVQPLEEALGNAPIILLTEIRPLKADFEIKAMPDEFGLKWVALVPRIQDTEFYRIEMGLDGEAIVEMKLYDHFDQQTIIRFSNVQKNPTISDDRFNFNIPDGVDVIGTPR